MKWKFLMVFWRHCEWFLEYILPGSDAAYIMEIEESSSF